MLITDETFASIYENYGHCDITQLPEPERQRLFKEALTNPALGEILGEFIGDGRLLGDSVYQDLCDHIEHDIYLEGEQYQNDTQN